MNAAATIAQGFLARPESLPDPGGIAYWLLERSTVTGAGVALLAALLFFALIRRDKAKLGVLLSALTLTTAFVIVAGGKYIVTDREQVIQRTRDFVRSAGAGVVSEVDVILATDVQARVGGQNLPGEGRESLINATRMLGETFTLQECVPKETQGVLTGPGVAQTQVFVRATPTGGPPSFSWWRIDWRKDPDDTWRAWTVECLLLNGDRPGPAILRMFN